MMTKLSRRQRRTNARQEGVAFTPQYSSGIRRDEKGRGYKVGGAPRTYKETFGIGYERFNNKFVTIAEVAK